MFSFADEAVIEVKSGNGGNGCISFRREKYIPTGGPDGGDGGRGGAVVFALKKNLRTLSDLRYRRFFKAKNGGDGQGNNRAGKNGADVTIFVPPGSTIFDFESGEKIVEFTGQDENQTFKYLEGGKGGWGNTRFKTSINRAPRYAHKGAPGLEKKLRVELSIMADVGLVGFPNAGKSSLLSAFTAARPKIASYPFTTMIPHLGVLRVGSDDVILADIPGIVEGASEGIGLGTKFLKHISRARCLLFLIDCSNDAVPNFLSAYKILKSELRKFSKELSEKPKIVLLNKIDLSDAWKNAAILTKKIEAEEGVKTFAISALSGAGLSEAKNAIFTLATSGKIEKKSNFLESRSTSDDDFEQLPGSEGVEFFGDAF